MNEREILEACEAVDASLASMRRVGELLSHEHEPREAVDVRRLIREAWGTPDGMENREQIDNLTRALHMQGFRTV